jgi:DNA-binding IclR family transcriptional regulator
MRGCKPRLRPRGVPAPAAHGVEALELVKAHPGIRVPQLAEKMGIRQNYLYCVLPGLARTGWS